MGVSSSIDGIQIVGLNGTSDGMSMDMKESEDRALDHPQVQIGKEPVKGASERMDDDIGQYDIKGIFKWD